MDDCVDDSLELGWRRCSKVYCETNAITCAGDRADQL